MRDDAEFVLRGGSARAPGAIEMYLLTPVTPVLMIGMSLAGPGGHELARPSQQPHTLTIDAMMMFSDHTD